MSPILSSPDDCSASEFMNASVNETPQRQAIDWLFSQLADGPRRAGVPEAAFEESSPAANSPLSGENEPEPMIHGPEDLATATEWIKREKRRLEEYTCAQITRLQNDHQSLLQQSYRTEQAVILRSQELNRKEEWLIAQGRAMQQRDVELSERELALAAQLHQWFTTQQELATLQEVHRSVRQDTEEQRPLLELSKTQTVALEQARETALAEREASENAMQEQRQVWAREAALHSARLTQVEQRLSASERTEMAGQRSLAELAEVEARQRQEVEEQVRRLDIARQELRGLEASIRSPTAEGSASLAARRIELDEREAELDRLEAQLHEVLLDLEQRFASLDGIGAMPSQCFGDSDDISSELHPDAIYSEV